MVASSGSGSAPHGTLRICLVYDCLFPWTVGGEERWLRLLGDQLAAGGHAVTYLTRQQWPEDKPPHIPGIDVIAVSPDEPLYGPDGSRRTAEAVRFAVGVTAHLARHRDSYDVVHTCGFPYFHVPGLRAALAGTRTPVVIDWPEVWSREYWRQYVGGPAGLAAEVVQRACVRLTPHALAFSDRYAGRLTGLGLSTAPLRLGGLGPAITRTDPELSPPPAPRIVVAGRQIREKRTVLAVQAVAAARRTPALRELTGVILGDGPEHERVLSEVTHLELLDSVETPGFVAAERVVREFRAATCLLHTSSREGFGIVVLEAAAVGTPVVIVNDPDNAAVELVQPGVNGEIAADATPAAIADAIGRVHEGGTELRRSTAAWYAEHAIHLAAEGTVARVEELYRSLLHSGS